MFFGGFFCTSGLLLYINLNVIFFVNVLIEIIRRWKSTQHLLGIYEIHPVSNAASPALTVTGVQRPIPAASGGEGEVNNLEKSAVYRTKDKQAHVRTYHDV